LDHNLKIGSCQIFERLLRLWIGSEIHRAKKRTVGEPIGKQSNTESITEKEMALKIVSLC
jgi:hypothetical protein